MDKDQQFYIEEFESEECQCGRSKRPTNAFCFMCYSSLPSDMQKALWQKIGDGFEQAYDEALKYLND